MADTIKNFIGKEYLIHLFDEDTILGPNDFFCANLMDVIRGDRIFTLPEARVPDIGKWMIFIRRGSANALKIYPSRGDFICGKEECIKFTDDHDYSVIQMIIIEDRCWIVTPYVIWNSDGSYESCRILQ